MQKIKVTPKKPKTEKPLTLKEIKKQLRSGKITQEQALILCQKYMDSLEYTGTAPICRSDIFTPSL